MASSRENPKSVKVFIFSTGYFDDDDDEQELALVVFIDPLGLDDALVAGFGARKIRIIKRQVGHLTFWRLGFSSSF